MYMIKFMNMIMKRQVQIFMNKVLFSSKSDEYSTPEWLFNKYNSEYNFDLDVCACEDNKKCDMYFDKKIDGLKQSWSGHIVWCNPPYSNIYEWVKKCYYENLKNNVTIVLLIPARTDTRYFHEFIYHIHEVVFLKGRLKFNNLGPAPFPSMIVIFKSR